MVTFEKELREMNSLFKLYDIDATIMYDPINERYPFKVQYNITRGVSRAGGYSVYLNVKLARRGVKELIHMATMPLEKIHA